MFDKFVFKLTGAGRTMVLLALFSLAGAGLTVLQAWALCRVLVELWAGHGAAGSEWLVAVFAAAFAGGRVVGALRERMLSRYAAARAGELREAALRRLIEDRSEAGGAGVAMGAAEGCDLVIEGSERVERYLELSLGKFVDMVAVPLVLAVALVSTDIVSGVIAIIGYPVIILYMVLIGSNAHAVAEERQREQARLSNHFLDALRGLDTLRAFGRARGHARAVFDVSERLRAATMRTLRVATLSSAVLDLVATFALAAVSVMLGFRLVDGQMELFPALMALVLVPDFYRPIRQFGADYHATLDGKQAFARMRAVVDASARPVAALPAGSWCSASELTARGLTASYDSFGDGSQMSHRSDRASRADAGPVPAAIALAPGLAPALAGVSFTLRGFERVGVVGASGSGKSTLASLLAGFMDPAEGGFQVRWNADAAAPASDVPGTLHASAWQRQVLYIPQHPYIFHASMADNIAFYVPDAPRDEIERAADAAGLGELVGQLPSGLDTVIGDGSGSRALSGGEAQRVAIARALLDRSRRILLLDEPTAHLDLETELELKQRMLPLMEGRLVVFATHRLHWLYDMDRVLVLEHGRLVADGDPRELMASGVIARSLEASAEADEVAAPAAGPEAPAATDAAPAAGPAAAPVAEPTMDGKGACHGAR